MNCNGENVAGNQHMSANDTKSQAAVTQLESISSTFLMGQYYVKPLTYVTKQLYNGNKPFHKWPREAAAPKKTS
jgi:hypothetical protein